MKISEIFDLEHTYKNKIELFETLYGKLEGMLPLNWVQDSLETDKFNNLRAVFYLTNKESYGEVLNTVPKHVLEHASTVSVGEVIPYRLTITRATPANTVYHTDFAIIWAINFEKPIDCTIFDRGVPNFKQI